MNISHLGTNLVELHFSEMRRKFRYFNYYQYCIVEQRAWYELMKTYATDRPYTIPKTIRERRVYKNNLLLKFSMEAVPLHNPKEKHQYYEKIGNQNEGTMQQSLKAKEYAKKFSPHNCLTIRQATCKESPFLLHQ